MSKIHRLKKYNPILNIGNTTVLSQFLIYSMFASFTNNLDKSPQRRSMHA